MWDAATGEHPDEGTIHAWLDGALDAASAERVAAHVRGCAACAALTAEARGLIAGASRVVAALDEVPAGTRPGWAQAEGGAGSVAGASTTNQAADRSLWRRLRVTPARAAIAATILVGLGVTLTHDRIAMESVQTLPAGHTEPRSGAVQSAPFSAPAVAQRADSVLDSAVARNLAIAQGTRRMEAAQSPAIPQAPPPGARAESDAPLAAAEERVAAGRTAVQALKDTAGVAADRLRVRGQVSGGAAGRAADEVAMAAPARQAMTGAAASVSAPVAKVSQGYADAGGRTCYSLESPQSGAMWGDQPLPLVVVVDSGPALGARSATVRSGPTGPATRAVWTRSAADSVVITLQRVGLTGRIALGPDAGGRAGTASSGAIDASRELANAEPASAGDARAKSLKRERAPAAPASPVVPGMATSAARLPVTLRPVACPTR